MNVLLWILQAALAFFYFAGGAYKVFKGDTLVNYVRWLPSAGWRAVGLVEVVGAVLLVIPTAVTGMPLLTVLAAAVLALETLAFAGIYARRSLKLVAANPLVWAAPMGLVALLVAIGRYALLPPP